MIVAVAVLLSAAALPAVAVPPPPGSVAPPPTVPTRDEDLARRDAVAAEIVAARARFEALAPDDTARRTDAAREVELLERTELVLGQLLSAQQTCDELTRTRDDLTTRREALRTTGPADAPPYSLLRLDALKDQVDAEARRAETIAAGLAAATDAGLQAEALAAERVAARRRAKEQLEAAEDSSARPDLARRLGEARLEANLAAETVRLRETESRREQLARDVHELRLEILRIELGWVESAVRFTETDLQTKLVEIEARESAVRQRTELLGRNAAFLERDWFTARRELDDAGGADPALLEEAEARKLASQALQRDLAVLGKQLERLADAKTIWNRRYEVTLGQVPRAILLEWATEGRRREDALATERRLVASQIDDLRAQLAKVAARLDGTETDAVTVRRALGSQQRSLRAMVESLETALVGIDGARSLQGRLLDSIGARTARVSLSERFSDLLGSLERVWQFQIGSVDDRPITIGKIAIGIFLLIFGLLASRFLSRLLGRQILPRLRLNEGAAAAVQTILFYALLVTFALFALRTVNIPLTAFTVLGGALAIGVGFGSQNVISNFISGLILLAERPVRVGDLIQLGDLHGTVEHLGARSTRVRTGTNIEIIVPNSAFLEQNVVNWTLTEDRIRTQINVGVAYGSPTRDVTKLLRRAVDEHGRILKKPEPIVLFRDFGDNALAFEVHFWIRMKRLMDRNMIESDIRHRIDNLFHEAGITIAFPQRDVHLDSLRPIEVRMVRDEKASAAADETVA